MTRIILKISAVVFAVEGLIMIGFAIAPHVDSVVVGALIDSTILILLASPLIYLWAIKPYVTAYQKAEQERLETQQKLKMAIDNIDDGFVFYDADDRLVLCNDKYRDYYSESADLIVAGAKFEDIIRAGAERGQYAQSAGRIDAWVAERMEQHCKTDGSIEQQLNDGRWLKIAERRMPDGGRVGVRVDITELKQAQARLEKTREELELRVEERTAELSATRDRLLQAVKVARLGHWRFDEVANVFLEVSVEYAQICGYTTVEAFLKCHDTLEKYLSLIHPEDIEKVRRAFDSGEDQQLDHRILRRDGEILYVREIFRYIRDADGNAMESVGTCLDITELKQSQLNAEAANLAKSRFLATMSHELRTPLNAILGYSELLIEQVAEDEQQALMPDLERISLSGRHLLDLVERILDLSNIESGRMELTLEPIDVDALVREVVAMIRPLIQINDNIFELESDQNIGSMLIDPIKLRQILLNLLSNAGKFTTNGHVALRVRKQCLDSVDWIVFRVSDSGIGIPGDHLDQVFELFRQVDDSSTRSYEGCGLGLAISQRLCQLMGGVITVESEPGGGSIFTVRLPRQQPVEVSVTAAEKAKSKQAGLPLVEGCDHDGY